MTTFINSPFWSTRSRGRVASHAVSVLVTPAVAIATSSVANFSVITTSSAHNLVSGDSVTIAGHAGSTPTVNGTRVVTVLTPTTVSIPVTVTVAGTGGTVTRSVPVAPLTLTEGKLRAGLDWTVGDDRDALMTGFIGTAWHQVEQDTGLVLLTQVRDVYVDALSGSVFTLPAQCLPLQSVTSITSTDTAGVVNTLATDQYVVDTVSGRIGLALGGSWPTDLRPFQPIVIRIVSGYPSIAAIPPLLVHAVGLLTGHYATVGRDVTTVGTIIATTPYGYEQAIAPYQIVSLA